MLTRRRFLGSCTFGKVVGLLLLHGDDKGDSAITDVLLLWSEPFDPNRGGVTIG